MFFSIEPSNGLPIYDQIVRQVKFAAANDALRPGDRVPSVRELARDLAVNPNTVARAYRELQSQGILSAVRGQGLEVTTDAVARCRKERTELIRQRLRFVLLEAHQSQLDDKEIRRLIEEELARFKSKGKSS